MATVEAPKTVASPKVVATQQAVSPAGVLAETGQALEMAGGSLQVSLLHVLGTCWGQCSSRVVQQCTADSPWQPDGQPVLGTRQPQTACLLSGHHGHQVEALCVRPNLNCHPAS